MYYEAYKSSFSFVFAKLLAMNSINCSFDIPSNPFANSLDSELLSSFSPNLLLCE